MTVERRRPSVALVDYGAGNLSSVRKGLSAAGADVYIPRTPLEIGQADAVVVPGVGNFQATAALDGDWRAAIQRAIAEPRPVLGVCLGLQWLFERSAEAPGVAGLGFFSGECRLLGERRNTSFPVGDGCASQADRLPPAMGDQKRFDADERPWLGVAAGTNRRLKVPHVGWNTLQVRMSSPLLEGVPDGAYVYFTHSYAAPETAETLATTCYGEPFASVAGRGLVFGVQFHPEKSGDIGLRILKNFIALARG